MNQHVQIRKEISHLRPKPWDQLTHVTKIVQLPPIKWSYLAHPVVYKVPELSLRPYKECELRTQQMMRAKAIDSLAALANKFVHFNDVPVFINDLVNSGKWQSTFGGGIMSRNPSVASDEHSFLGRLAAEYKRCKDKDTNKEIRKNAAKQSQRVLIGD